MNSSKKDRIGTQSSTGPVGFEPFYKVGPVNIFYCFANLCKKSKENLLKQWI